MGRKRPRAKTKTVLKPVNKMKQLAGMPRTNKEKNLNRKPPRATVKKKQILYLNIIVEFDNTDNIEM